MRTFFSHYKSLGNNIIFILLHIHACIIYFATICESKTYKVHRLNDSTYLVTSYPEWKYDELQFVHNNNVVNDERKEHFIDGKRESSSSNSDTANAINVGGRSKETSTKIPSSLIAKARENYFRTFYATMKSPEKPVYVLTNKMFGPTRIDTKSEITALSHSNGVNNENLVMARKLASILLGEIQFYSHLFRM